MIGTLLIALPGYGVALWFVRGTLSCLIGWARAENGSSEEREYVGGMVLSAAGAMLFGSVTRALLGGTL